MLKAWKSVEGTGELTPRGMWFAGLLMRNIGRSKLSPIADLHVILEGYGMGGVDEGS